MFMGTTSKIAIAVLVLIAIALGVIGYMMTQRPAPLPVQSQVVASNGSAGYPVVVAAQTISAGFPIAANAVKVLAFPEQPAGAFTRPAEVVGAVPAVAIGQGVPVLRSNLVSGLATQIPAGFRALALHVNEVIAVGDHLRPGDFVDVFFVLPGQQGAMAGTAPTQARLLCPDLRVMAVGPQTVNKEVALTKPTPMGPAAQKQTQYQAPATPPQSVVLEVPTAEVAKLVLGEQSGQLFLALRNPEDDKVPTPHIFPTPPPALAPSLIPVAAQKSVLKVPENRAYAGLTLPGLAGEKKAQAAAAARVAPRPLMEIYLGNKKSALPY
jgi:pilus assembly protein CpaB